MCHVQTQRFKGLVLVYCEWFGQFWVKNAWMMTLKAGWECMSLHKYWEKTGAVMNLLDFCKKIYLHNVGFFGLFMKVLSASIWCIRQDHAVNALQSKPCTYVKDHWPLWLHWDFCLDIVAAWNEYYLLDYRHFVCLKKWFLFPELLHHITDVKLSGLLSFDTCYHCNPKLLQSKRTPFPPLLQYHHFHCCSV